MIKPILTLLSVCYVSVFAAVMADLAAGVRKARLDGRVCTSRGLRRSVSKLTSYYLSLICLTVVDAIVIAAIVAYVRAGAVSPMPPLPYCSTLGALSLVMIEVRSIAENSPHKASWLHAISIVIKLIKKINHCKSRVYVCSSDFLPSWFSTGRGKCPQKTLDRSRKNVYFC